MHNRPEKQCGSSPADTAARPNRLGVVILYVLLFAAVIAMLFVFPPEAVRVVRAA